MKFIRLFSAMALLALACCGSSLKAQSAQQTVALGLVARTSNAQIGSAAASEGSAIYSGDELSTSDDGSLLVRIGALALELQKSTSVHIYRAPYGAVVELDRGSVLYTTPGGAQNLVIVASDVRVTTALASADFGRVTMDDPCNVTVSSQRGEANVKVGSENRTVEEGKSYRVRAENRLTYRKYLSPDADNYHDYHEHIPCAAAAIPQGHPPLAPATSHFLLVTAIGVGTGTGVVIYKALESPSQP
ncbi:MAG TPA: hypothetical protein VMF32_20840 [Xanthobacteraceae bacterium]|nr:hypothetical protein [Xanthobacteraceae bacterium]